MVDVLGDRVVGRPPGAGDRGDGGAGHPQFDDRVGGVATVAGRGLGLGSVDVDELADEVTHLVEVHGGGVEGGCFLFECLDVAPAQLECSSGLLQGDGGPAGVADAEAGRRACDGRALGVGAYDAHRRHQEAELAGPVVRVQRGQVEVGAVLGAVDSVEHHGFGQLHGHERFAPAA